MFLKSDVFLVTCVFEILIKVSIIEPKIILLFCVSLPGYSRQCGLEHTWINLKTHQAKNLILVLEKNIRGGINSIKGDIYVNSDKNKKIFYMDANNMYSHSMSQPLPYDEIKFNKNVKLEDILKTPDDSDLGYFIEVDLR